MISAAEKTKAAKETECAGGNSHRGLPGKVTFQPRLEKRQRVSEGGRGCLWKSR